MIEDEQGQHLPQCIKLLTRNFRHPFPLCNLIQTLFDDYLFDFAVWGSQVNNLNKTFKINLLYTPQGQD